MSTVEASQKWVGQALKRKEDPRMITGRGRYVDDMVMAGMLPMHVVRSDPAHAKIVSIDATGAREGPRGYGGFTPADPDPPPPPPVAGGPPRGGVRPPPH